MSHLSVLNPTCHPFYLHENYSTSVSNLFCGPSLVLHELLNIINNGLGITFAVFGALRLKLSKTGINLKLPLVLKKLNKGACTLTQPNSTNTEECLLNTVLMGRLRNTVKYCQTPPLHPKQITRMFGKLRGKGNL